MIREIANILRNKLKALDFLDKVAGLVQTIKQTKPTEIETAFVVTKFPVSSDVNYEECFRNGCFKDLIPNSKNKGVLYFEDLGTRPMGFSGGAFQYESKIRCVVWINNKLIQQSDNCQSILHKLQTYVRVKLESGYFNEGDFQKIYVKATNLIENDYSIFNRYTYPAEAMKYIFWPYEAFAIDYVVTYQVNPNCLTEFTPSPNVCTT